MVYDLSMKILLFGTFDHLHPGHHFVFNEALKRGEVWVVIARDKNVEKIKGRAPEQSEEERKQTIEKVFPAVHTVLGDPENFLVPVREIRPDLILLGYDQKLPPGVLEKDLQCSVERLEAFSPEKYKSSLLREEE